jgi:hypothetical protein
MSREQIEVITYEKERLDYFTELMTKAQKRYKRLFEKHQYCGYMSAEYLLLCDAGRKAHFHGDVVEMLEKGNQKQSEWISVDERLPSADEMRDEYGELVPFLVVEKDTTQPFRAFYDGFVWGDGFVKLDVTHWMPLPEPPMMKGGAE